MELGNGQIKRSRSTKVKYVGEFCIKSNHQALCAYIIQYSSKALCACIITSSHYDVTIGQCSKGDKVIQGELGTPGRLGDKAWL